MRTYLSIVLQQLLQIVEGEGVVMTGDGASEAAQTVWRLCRKAVEKLLKAKPTPEVRKMTAARSGCVVVTIPLAVVTFIYGFV